MSESNAVPSRRRFLCLVAATAAASACGAQSPAAPAAIGDVAAGNVGDLAVGSVRAVGSQPVAIGRDAQGVYAMTLTCTHEGCNMARGGTIGVNGLACPCHGATFDANGAATGGPARGDLVHYAVEVDATGAITIHGGTQVGASVRVPV